MCHIQWNYAIIGVLFCRYRGILVISFGHCFVVKELDGPRKKKSNKKQLHNDHIDEQFIGEN
jgi:hypothetical protein